MLHPRNCPRCTVVLDTALAPGTRLSAALQTLKKSTSTPAATRHKLSHLQIETARVLCTGGTQKMHDLQRCNPAAVLFRPEQCFSFC